MLFARNKGIFVCVLACFPLRFSGRLSGFVGSFFFSTPNDASSLLTVNPEDPTRESKYQRNGVWLGNADLRLIFFPWFFFWFKGSGHGQPRILFRFLSSRSMSKGI